MIHWELNKRLNLDHTNWGYIHKPESVLENETYKTLKYLKKIELVKIKESKKIDKYFDLAWELKKTEEHEDDGENNYRIGKES